MLTMTNITTDLIYDFVCNKENLLVEIVHRSALICSVYCIPLVTYWNWALIHGTLLLL